MSEDDSTGLSKKELGINGIHSSLGKQLSDAEFKGYMIAKVQDIERRIDEGNKNAEKFQTHMDELKKEADVTHTKMGGRISKLEKFKTQAYAIVSVLAILLTFLLNEGLRLIGWK
jgi:uncharacterized coiled-coil DUF342 family protein